LAAVHGGEQEQLSISFQRSEIGVVIPGEAAIRKIRVGLADAASAAARGHLSVGGDDLPVSCGRLPKTKSPT